MKDYQSFIIVIIEQSTGLLLNRKWNRELQKRKRRRRKLERAERTDAENVSWSIKVMELLLCTLGFL